MVSLRRRWGSGRSDPGRAVRDAAFTNGAGSRHGEGAGQSVRRQFIGRASLIRCPHAGCAGVMLTARRQISHPGGTGSRVILHCTREPERHETTIAMEPYAPDEVERLRSAVIRQEESACARCGAPMVGPGGTENGDADSARSSAAYYCTWCGVCWISKKAATERHSKPAAVADDR